MVILTDEFSIYGGYSVRSGITDKNTPTIEGGIKFNKFNLFLNFKYFKTEYISDYRSLLIPFGDHLFSSEGLGLSLNYKFWYLLLETNTSYYFEVKEDNLGEAGYEPSKNLPDWQFSGGIYVNNLFFENNLDLKAGFRFYHTGTINTSLIYNGTNVTVYPTNKLDFTLAGEIKKVAIVYFIWENLFGNQYYITPYYPMPERNIRFGLAWELFN